MRILGLTGNIACGKSTLAALLKAHGATILDADKLVHELYADVHFSQQVARLFPNHKILNATRTVDRTLLSTLVFQDSDAMRRLEALVHPGVAALRDEKLRELESLEAPPEVVVLEAVKLIESAQVECCEEVWCVVCAPKNQLQRMIQTRGLSQAEAQARLDAQPTLAQKKSLLATLEIPLVCIENNGSIEDLKQNVDHLWQEFLKREFQGEGNAADSHSPDNTSQKEAPQNDVSQYESRAINHFFAV